MKRAKRKRASAAPPVPTEVEVLGDKLLRQDMTIVAMKCEERALRERIEYLEGIVLKHRERENEVFVAARRAGYAGGLKSGAALARGRAQAARRRR